MTITSREVARLGRRGRLSRSEVPTEEDSLGVGVRRAGSSRDRSKGVASGPSTKGRDTKGAAPSSPHVSTGRKGSPPSVPRPEREVVKAVLEYLKLRPDVIAWRQNSGMMRGSYKGKDRVIRFGGMPGMADIIGWVEWPGEHAAISGITYGPRSVAPAGQLARLGKRAQAARFLAIECKSEGWQAPTRPSPALVRHRLQQAFLDLVRSSGGIAIVATSVSDVVAALEGR